MDAVPDSKSFHIGNMLGEISKDFFNFILSIIKKKKEEKLLIAIIV